MTLWRKDSPSREKNQVHWPGIRPMLSQQKARIPDGWSSRKEGKGAGDGVRAAAVGKLNVLKAKVLPMARGGLERNNAVMVVT